MNERQKEMVESALPLVGFVIKKHGLYAQDPAMQYDDLFQVGTIGLCKAAINYLEARCVFSTYAYKCIFNEISMELRKRQCKSRAEELRSARLEELILHEEKMTIGDVIADPRSKTDAFLDETPVQDFVENLKCRNPTLFRAMIGEITQSEAGGILGITQSYVSRLLKKEKDNLLKVMST